jgi:hypothetical protein
MNEPYAIEPSAFESKGEVRRILRQFGPLHGRYVGEFPERWKDGFLQHIASWGEVEQLAAKEALLKARLAFERSGHEYYPSESWIENLRRVQRSDRPFRGAVVARKSASDEDSYHTADDFEPCGADSVVKAPLDAKKFVSLARPLIRRSDEILLIDPFFSIADFRHRDFLREILAECICGSCKSVVIWTGIKFAEGTKLDFQEIKRRTRYTGALLVQPVVAKPGRSDFHDRYFFSIHGGLELSKGFQPSKKDQVVKVIPEALLDALVSEFVDLNNDLDRGAPISV